jgi:hypothetical protein
MRNILTADQFLNSILATLKLCTRDDYVLEDNVSLDQRFERAYETLLQHEKDLGVTPNFTFFRDPLHGNSVKLRNALLAAKENGLLFAESGAVVHLPAQNRQQAGRNVPEPLSAPQGIFEGRGGRTLPCWISRCHELAKWVSI